MDKTGLQGDIGGLSPAKRTLLESILRGKGVKTSVERIPRLNVEGPVPLSFGQQRLWFLDQLNPNSPAYNIPIAYQIDGPLDAVILRQALNKIVARHGTLRTMFQALEGQPYQVVLPSLESELPIIDLTDLPPDQRDDKLQRLLSLEASRPISLEQAPFMRNTLYCLGKQEHVLLTIFHHSVADGWSVGVFLRELETFYRMLSGESVPPIPELPIQYTDYAVWQRRHSQDEALQQQLGYWRRKLAGALPNLDLPTDHPRSDSRVPPSGRASTDWPAGMMDALQSLAEKERATLYMVFLAAFNTLLYRYTGQEEIIVGSPIAGRIRVEFENLIGCFVNTLVLRNDLSGNPTFRQLLSRVRETALEAYANQDFPFDRLVEEIKPERSAGHTPLFEVALNLRNIPRRPVTIPGLTFTRLAVDSGTARFDLDLTIVREGQGTSHYVDYNAALYDRETIARMLGQFQNILGGALRDPDQRISDLPLLTDSERRQVLVDWNNTATKYPKDSSIQALFEAQVGATPDAVALVYEDTQLTYCALNNRANQLAHKLIEMGVGPEVGVGICVERSIEMIIGLLAILKAGGAYVPLDHQYPKERLEYMLQDARVEVLLTQTSLLDRLPDSRPDIVCLDSNDATYSVNCENPPINSTGGDLAYVIYTSGSTGEPKGVGVVNRGVIRLVKSTNYVDIQPSDVFLQYASLAFDASTFEIWGCLLNGAKLVIAPPGVQSLDQLGRILMRYGVTILWLTAPLFHAMVDHDTDCLKRLRILLAGGDVLSVPHVERAARELKGCRLVNCYGPAESTTFAVCHEIAPGSQFETSVPIGRPISNTRAYILDPQLQPVPIGIPGELYIGGDGLAWGYLSNLRLTDEKFVRSPFNDGERLYRTGDRARWLPDGSIEFLGRLDAQLKVRGYRIEPGEVQSALAKHSSVKESFVMIRDVGPEKALTAYIVPSDKKDLDVSKLKSVIAGKLPDHMVPSAFVILDSMPLSANGKVDRTALPLPERPADRKLVHARDGLERALVGIWQEVLHTKPIGVTDNFFDLGGHSLLAVRLFADINRKMGKDLPLAALFQFPTIAQLADLIRDGGWSQVWTSLAPLQPNGSRTPLFLVHAAGGNQLSYRELVSCLDPDMPVYGFQETGLHGAPDARIEKMAAHYVQAMKSVQPKGPYMLAGCSFGGALAFEMARQIRAQGEEVSLLAMLDARSPDSLKYAKRLTFAERLTAFLSRVRTMNPKEQFISVFGLAKQQAHRLLVKATYIFCRLCDLQVPDSYRKLGILYFHELALKRYEPEPYPGKVVLFQAGEEGRLEKSDRRLTWENFAQGGVDVIQVPGDHGTFIEEPNVQVLARKLQERINAGEIRNPQSAVRNG